MWSKSTNALVLGALAGACLISGCKPKSSADNNATTSASATTGDTSSMSSMSNTDTTANMSNQNAKWSDANIVALLDEANKADSAGGAYALTKATSPDVKAFAKMMMGEHHALRVEGQKLAKQLGVTPQPPADDPLPNAAQDEMTALKSAPKGAQFDRTYIEQEVGIHKAVLDLGDKAHEATQNEQLKALIEKAKPVIQKHLDRAEAIQKKLGTNTA
jgi:putative membrane protein